MPTKMFGFIVIALRFYPLKLYPKKSRQEKERKGTESQKIEKLM